VASEPDNVKVNRKKSPGRKRRAAGWTLLLLGLLVAGVWVASGWWWFGYAGRNSSLEFVRGRIDIGRWSNPGQSTGWSVAPAPGLRGRFVWWGTMPTYDAGQGFTNWNAGFVRGAKLLQNGVVKSEHIELFWWPIPPSIIMLGASCLWWNSRGAKAAAGSLPRRRGGKMADASRG
jgi:hypothetical protein